MDLPKKTPNHIKTLHEKDKEKRLIVILENASLETVKVIMLLDKLYLLLQ